MLSQRAEMPPQRGASKENTQSAEDARPAHVSAHGSYFPSTGPSPPPHQRNCSQSKSPPWHADGELGCDAGTVTAGPLRLGCRAALTASTSPEPSQPLTPEPLAHPGPEVGARGGGHIRVSPRTNLQAASGHKGHSGEPNRGGKGGCAWLGDPTERQVPFPGGGLGIGADRKW